MIPRGSKNDRPEKCPTPGKMCWVSPSLAIAMAKYTTRLEGGYMRAYHCVDIPGSRKGCGYYHLTSKKKEEVSV
jgi:hypothetical protein